MTKMEFTGIVTVEGLVRTSPEGAATKWASQQFCMEEEGGRYPMSIAFDVFNDKVALSKGERCTVHLDVKATAGKDGKYFTNINCYQKDLISPAPAGSTMAQPAQPAPQTAPAQAATTPDIDPPF